MTEEQKTTTDAITAVSLLQKELENSHIKWTRLDPLQILRNENSYVEKCKISTGERSKNEYAYVHVRNKGILCYSPSNQSAIIKDKKGIKIIIVVITNSRNAFVDTFEIKYKND